MLYLRGRDLFSSLKSILTIVQESRLQRECKKFRNIEEISEKKVTLSKIFSHQICHLLLPLFSKVFYTLAIQNFNFFLSEMHDAFQEHQEQDSLVPGCHGLFSVAGVPDHGPVGPVKVLRALAAQRSPRQAQHRQCPP